MMAVKTVRSVAIWMTLILLPVAVKSVSVAKCNEDFACEYNYYCYKQSGICIQCLDCSRYNRATSIYQSCHRSPDDCGACLPGFSEEYLAQQVKRQACVAVTTPTNTTTTTTAVPTATTTVTTTTTGNETTHANFNTGPKWPVNTASAIPRELIMATAIVSVLCIIIFSFIGVYIFKHGKRKETPGRVVGQDLELSCIHRESTASPLLPLQVGNLNGSSSTLHNRPPSYNEIGPEQVSEERTVVLHLPELKMKANSLDDLAPCEDTEHSRSCSPEGIESYQDPETESNQPSIHDEETTPSIWEPTEDQRPRNTLGTSSSTVHIEVPEANLVHPADPVHPSDLEAPLDPARPSPSCSPETPGAREVHSSCQQLDDADRPFRHLSGHDDFEEPARKRLCQEDAVSLDERQQHVSIVPLCVQDSCSSLAQELIAIPRFPAATCNSIIRRA